jgi:hypothetical protein
MDNQSLENSIETLSQALKDLAKGQSSPDLVGLTHLEFTADKGKNNYGKGLVFKGHGTTKQITLAGEPDRFILTENLDLGKDKSYMINRIKVLDQTELGPSVTKSSLRELGKLKGLIVEGSISVNQDIYYDSQTEKLGLGTEEPHAKLSIVDRNIEVIIGSNDQGKAEIGTFSNQDLDLVVGRSAKISLKSNNVIDLGNPNSNPSSVRIHGKLSVGVKVPDTNVDLHIAGPVRLNNRLQIIAEAAPTAGNYNIGDIVWNSNPKSGGTVGWICTRSGDPGVWNRFGEIK